MSTDHQVGISITCSSGQSREHHWSPGCEASNSKTTDDSPQSRPSACFLAKDTHTTGQILRDHAVLHAQYGAIVPALPDSLTHHLIDRMQVLYFFGASYYCLLAVNYFCLHHARIAKGTGLIKNLHVLNVLLLR
ncbi:hypothetical protein BDV12DRAFT_104121 [Aspergillus spectabilis]